MVSPSLEQRLSMETLYEIDDALGELFDRILDVLADTDHFGNLNTPSLFIVYAHDTDDSGNARARCVHYLITWLGAVRSRTLSDKAPLPLWSPREGGNAAARNILSNQFCLLPQRNLTITCDEEITSVDKVVLCRSSVLKEYFEHDFASKYINDIINSYEEAERQGLQSASIQARIREKVESQCNEVGFHHVLTELAFLKLRYPNGAGNDDRIIPVSLGEDEMDRMMRDFLQIDNCDLRLKSGSVKSGSQKSMAPQHKLFFNLLRQMYPDSHTVINTFSDCYDKASEKLRKKGAITTAILRDIMYNELFKAFDTWVRLGSAAIRNEKWRNERRARTKEAFSLRDEIIDWLPNLDDVMDTQDDNLNQRYGFTGAWILTNEKYEKWKYLGSNEKNNRRWCFGEPGAGKTIISSIIIEDLQDHVVEPLTALAYVFCKHDEDQTAWSLVLSLVAQLARQRHELSAKLINIAQKCKARKLPTAPKPYECEQMLMAEVGQFDKAFIVVDALDERLNNSEADKLMDMLLKTNAKILVTSRVAGSIDGYFLLHESRIEIRARREDVKAYLEYRVEQPSAHLLSSLLQDDPTLKTLIVESLLDKTDGMFLLPRMNIDLLLDEIKRYGSVRTITLVLKNLPSALNKAYDEYIRRILASDSAEHARDVLGWVLFAKQPVQMEVVQQAISLRHCRNQINDLIRGSELLGYCIGLLVESVTGSLRGTLTFVHPDTERYFRMSEISGKIQDWFPDGQQRIASSCLRCLLLLEDPEAQARSPLWRYAAQYWGYHVESKYAELQSSISEYLSQPKKVSSALRHSMLESPPKPIPNVSWSSASSPPRFTFSELCQHELPSQCYGWHAAAFFGISQHFRAARQEDIDCRDSNGWTPLWWALLGKQDTTVELLLQQGAKTNTKSHSNIPLAAWILGIEEIRSSSFECEGLVVEDATLIVGEAFQLPARLSFSDALEVFGFRTWQIATKQSIDRVIDTLHDNEVNAEDGRGNTLLMTASRLWQWDVARLLLAKGANKFRRNSSGSSAFSLGMKDFWRSFTVRKCVATGNSRLKFGASIVLLSTTSLNPYDFGKLESVETILLQLFPTDLHPNSQECQQALRLAINNRYSRVVQELLRLGADTNTRYEDGSTPLLLACMSPISHLFEISDIVTQDATRLLAGLYVSTSNSSILDYFGLKISPPATDAFPRQSEEDGTVSLRPFDCIVQMLLKNKADIEAKHEVLGCTALALAAQSEYLTIFRTLLANGADITQCGVELEKIRSVLGHSMTVNGVYGRATLGTLGDFETHDYCTLLLGFVIPRAQYRIDRSCFMDESVCVFGNILDIGLPISLWSGGGSGSSAQEHWTPWKEYRRRVNAKEGREQDKLLARVEAALKREEPRLDVCPRAEFWTFGDPGWSSSVTGAGSLEHRNWIRQWQCWTELFYWGLLGVYTPAALDAPCFRLRPLRQGFQIEACGIGFRQKQDFWMLPGTWRPISPQLGYILLKSFLVWRHVRVGNAFIGRQRSGVKQRPARTGYR